MSRIIVIGAFVFGALSGFLVGQNVKPRPPIAYQLRVDTLVKEAARLDTVWKVKTLRYTSAMTRYDSVRVTDTIVRNDTVFIPRAAADSTVLACRSVISTCEAQKANLSARLAVAESAMAHRDIKPLLMAGGIGLILGLLFR